MFKYSVLILILVAFGAADEESKSVEAKYKLYKQSRVEARVETKEKLDKLRIILEVVRNECAKDTQAVNNLVSASEHVKSNVQPDLQKKVTDALSNTTKERAADVVVPVCEGLDRFKNIYVNLTGYIVPCLEKNDMKTLQATYKMIDGAIKYTCDSHRSDVIDFIKNRGFKCLQDKQTELEACRNSAFGSILNVSSEKSDGDNSDEDDFDFVITKEHCDMFKNFKTCTTKTLKDCPFTAAASTLASLLDSALVEMPCYEAVPELDNNTYMKKRQSRFINFFLPNFLSLLEAD